MKSIATPLFLLLPLLFSLFGCEPPEEKEEEPEVIQYATLSVEAATEGEGGDVIMTESLCTSDSDTGFFEGNFTAEDGSLLVIKIKGFSTGSGSYTCSQASDNAMGGIGNKFDGCAIELVIPDASTSLNTYAMHRSGEDVKDFTYSGTCTITTAYMEPQVSGTISCTGLVQTGFQGAPRNPIDPNATADVVGESSFFCDI